jgi:signal transduction histidine kinase
MKIRTRLILLLGCLLAFLGVSVGLLQTSHRKEVRAIFGSLLAERSDLLDRLLALTGQSLENFANDYSLWDEMVQFTRTGDPAWAAINIDASLGNFNTQAACVLRPDGTLLYGTGLIQHAVAGTMPVPIDDPLFLKKLREEKTLHFFHATAAGLYEVRSAPILPSNDLKREEVPRGWLLVARLWDEKQLRALAEALQSHVALSPPGPAAENAPLIRLQREFPDWQGKPLRTLYVEYQSQPLVELFKSNRDEAFLLAAFGIAIILAVVVGLSRWVIRPLHHLGQSLEAGSAGPLGELPRSSDEFGHIARQVAQSFEQRDALQASEERQRESMDLRGRLARDLHDGIIQAIYAAGLGLESARNLRATDPAAAEQRLAICQKMLNDTLWQVRNFIEALEPEEERNPTLAQSLATLASTMRSLQAIAIVAEADDDLARRIGRHQEMHLLQMAREAVSNAMRHSGASEVRISLRPTPDGPAVLEISDDGAGFDAALQTGTGRGLSNLATRAREIGAKLLVDSSPGKGARITIQFSPMP